MKTEKFESFVVGKETKVSKNNGEPYGLVSIMDGTDVLSIMTKDKALFDSVQAFSKCDVVLDVKMGKYPKVEFVSIVMK